MATRIFAISSISSSRDFTLASGRISDATKSFSQDSVSLASFSAISNLLKKSRRDWPDFASTVFAPILVPDRNNCFANVFDTPGFESLSGYIPRRLRRSVKKRECVPQSKFRNAPSACGGDRNLSAPQLLLKNRAELDNPHSKIKRAIGDGSHDEVGMQNSECRKCISSEFKIPNSEFFS